MYISDFDFVPFVPHLPDGLEGHSDSENSIMDTWTRATSDFDSSGVFIKLADNLRPKNMTEERSKRQSQLLQAWCFSNEVASGMKFRLGSHEIVNYEYEQPHTGFFSTIQAAYNNHWVLKTRPQDWWLTISQIITSAIDNHANDTLVRQYFVSHEERKKLTVHIGTSINKINTEEFFQQMISLIRGNINKPDYTNIMAADFSQSNSIDRIVGSITLMASFKEYFNYEAELACGIPGVIMLGAEDDWMSLIDKLEKVESLLKPIDQTLQMANWFDSCKMTLKNLLDTYRRNPDKKWWSQIMTIRSFGSGHQTELSGWVVRDFMGLDLVDRKNLPSGVNIAPLTIMDGDSETKAVLVAGVTGYTLAANAVNANNMSFPTVQSELGWALFA